MWARQDDPEGYARAISNDLQELLKICVNHGGTHTDVAQVVYRKYGDRFVCASLRLNIWYEFRGHRWVQSDGACELRRLLSSEVWKDFRNEGDERNRQATNDNGNMMHLQLAKAYHSLAQRLKVTSYKDNVIKECREHFYVEKFEDKLDSNPHLIGFENGVYDLEKHEFRDGKHDDYITFSTGIDYTPYDPSHPCVQEIYEFFDQVLPKRHMREYVLTLLASFITGLIIEERFHIWTGCGSNGKSKAIELFESSMGDYCCKFPVTLLTQKRIVSNAANAELARAKGRRFACMQEPSEDEHLNIGLMKELSGGDKITARALYAMPVEFKPMFKMLLMCNHLPSCPSDDNGTWRRVRVVEFTSKFVADPDPADPHQFRIDMEVSRKFEYWRPHFMGMLLDYYRKYQIDGIHEPPDVLATTKEYQRSNDYIADFVADRLEMVPGGSLPVDEMYSEIRAWFKNESMKGNLPRRRELVTIMERKFGRTIKRGGYFYFKDMQVRSDATVDGEEVEE